MEENKHVKTAVWLRSAEKSAGIYLEVWEKKKMILGRNKKGNGYMFDHIIDTSNQNQVYDILMKPLVEKALEGYDCTVLACGPSDTGETFTIGFESSVNGEECGMVQRMINSIFSSENAERIKVSISFIEVYNDDGFDLLGNNPEEPFFKKADGEMTELTRKSVQNNTQVLRLLAQGTKNRRAKMNATSSRSHVVLTINLGIEDSDGNKRESAINLVNLAGSERVDNTGSTGQISAERTSIKGYLSRDLPAFKQVVRAVSNGSIIIPLDSAITMILSKSLTSECYLTVLGCVSLLLCDFGDTSATLDFLTEIKSSRSGQQTHSRNNISTTGNSSILKRRDSTNTNRNKVVATSSCKAIDSSTKTNESLDLNMTEVPLDSTMTGLPTSSVLDIKFTKIDSPTKKLEPGEEADDALVIHLIQELLNDKETDLSELEDLLEQSLAEINAAVTQNEIPMLSTVAKCSSVNSSKPIKNETLINFDTMKSEPEEEQISSDENVSLDTTCEISAPTSDSINHGIVENTADKIHEEDNIADSTLGESTLLQSAPKLILRRVGSREGPSHYTVVLINPPEIPQVISSPRSESVREAPQSETYSQLQDISTTKPLCFRKVYTMDTINDFSAQEVREIVKIYDSMGSIRLSDSSSSNRSSNLAETGPLRTITAQSNRLSSSSNRSWNLTETGPLRNITAQAIRIKSDQPASFKSDPIPPTLKSGSIPPTKTGLVPPTQPIQLQSVLLKSINVQSINVQPMQSDPAPPVQVKNAPEVQRNNPSAVDKISGKENKTGDDHGNKKKRKRKRNHSAFRVYDDERKLPRGKGDYYGKKGPF